MNKYGIIVTDNEDGTVSIEVGAMTPESADLETAVEATPAIEMMRILTDTIANVKEYTDKKKETNES